MGWGPQWRGHQIRRRFKDKLRGIVHKGRRLISKKKLAESLDKFFLTDKRT